LVFLSIFSVLKDFTRSFQIPAFSMVIKIYFNICCLPSLPYLDVGISDRNLHEVAASGFLNSIVSNFGSAGFCFLRHTINSYSEVMYFFFKEECS